jgi:AraC-like DNA-binding protein
VSLEYSVSVRFHRPPQDMQRYFTTFYCVDVFVGGGGRISDYLHPEWANLRFYSGMEPEAAGEDGSKLSNTTFAATGPSSKAVRFSMGTARMWGIGLHPAGWARFVQAPASNYANAVRDGFRDPAFAPFCPLAMSLYGLEPDEAAEYHRITAHFRERMGQTEVEEPRIGAIHTALVDPEVAKVRDLVERSGVSQRTLERICERAFGFRPQILLRRQRFMRSLAQYMLDPSLKWIGAIDGHYHDQAQFVRDFRDFMGMTPREYAALDKPIIGAIMHERARFALAAVQALDAPDASKSAERGRNAA